jgi:hypothetical protein
MDVSGRLHAPDDLLQRKCPRYPLKGRLDETQRRSVSSREEINLIRSQGLEPRLLGNLASRCRSQQNPTSPVPSFIYQLKRRITRKIGHNLRQMGKEVVLAYFKAAVHKSQAPGRRGD